MAYRPSQNLTHDHTIYERRKERLGKIPFCIWSHDSQEIINNIATECQMLKL